VFEVAGTNEIEGVRNVELRDCRNRVATGVSNLSAVISGFTDEPFGGKPIGVILNLGSRWPD
jgi:hypothetical protein